MTWLNSDMAREQSSFIHTTCVVTTGNTHQAAAKQKHAQFRHLGQELLLDLIQITILQSLPEMVNELKFMRISAQTLMKPGFISNVVALCRRFKRILQPYAVLYPLVLLSFGSCAARWKTVLIYHANLEIPPCKCSAVDFRYIQTLTCSLFEIMYFCRTLGEKIMKMPKL